MTDANDAPRKPKRNYADDLDYPLREGVARTGSALSLRRSVGLAVGDT